MAYVELLASWNRRINLVGRNTIGDAWRRHILDSAQLFSHLPCETETLVDLGSGAGFPGLVLSILGVPAVHLIEADMRKAVFLREAVRVTQSSAAIHPVRIERAKLGPVDVVTARALAALPELLALAEPFLGPKTLCLFLKGQNIAEELTVAGKSWKMMVNCAPSQSDPTGSVLRLEAIRREPSSAFDRDGRP